MKKVMTLVMALVLAASCAKAGAEGLKGNTFTATGQFGTPIVLEFHPTENRVFGKVVNRYNGPYTIDGDRISFGLMAATMMMGIGDTMKDEQAYFQFLPKVERFEISGDKLILKAANGESMTFTRSAKTESNGGK